MNTRTWGIVAGVVGSAVGAWWWVRKQTALYNAEQQRARDRGTVIFDNTPTAAAGEGL